MGIKHFFFWFKKQFSQNITNVSKTTDTHIDNLLLDLNGIFHNSAQKVFKYGNFKEANRLLGKNQVVVNSKENIELVYSDICKSIDNLVSITSPRKRVVLCIDGVAPISKQNQQRQRRFRSSFETNYDEVQFDSNCITPGTKFMHNLSIYLDSHLKHKKVTGDWGNIEIIFSSEKVPGEGEHKAVGMIRTFGKEEETYCINGMDADLIMLAMATHKKNFYILRDDCTFGNYFLIDVGQTRKTLTELLKWKDHGEHKFNEKQAIDDFIFMCFMVGNDFLPHIPSVEIIGMGIEMMIDIYIPTCSNHGHLTTTAKNGKVTFNKEALRVFLSMIGNSEQKNFEEKLSKKESSFPDPILIKHSHNDSSGSWHVNIEGYIDDYNKKSFPDETASMDRICHQYLQGMQWVLTYYTTGVPSWKWYFPYQYAPTASTIAKHVNSFEQVRYGKTKPNSNFEQLLSVLPPKSAHLIPSPLDKLLETAELKIFCPDKLTIDLAGKRKEWEGITVLPMVDHSLISKMYTKHISLVSTNDLLLNNLEDNLKY